MRGYIKRNLPPRIYDEDEKDTFKAMIVPNNTAKKSVKTTNDTKDSDRKTKS